MRARAFVAAVVLLVAAAGARAASPCLRGAGRDWRDGPARYLLSEDEWRRFGRLETDAARAAFVTRFWGRLEGDTAGTGEGFRQRYERRCLEAEERFTHDDPPGWRSDRGRVLLLLGEPAAIEELPGEAESIGREIWVYRIPGTTGEPTLRIPFYRRYDGRIRLEAPRAATNVGTPVVFDAIRGRLLAPSRYVGPPRAAFAGALIDAILARPTVEPPPRPPGLAPAPSPPPTVEGTVASSALVDGAWFFQASDGSVLALVAVAVRPESGLDDASVRGSVFVVDGASVGPPETPEPLALAPERASGPSRRLHVARVHLEPGVPARLRLAFTDAERRTMLVRTRRLDVPELGTGGFAASSIVPAESFGPLPDGLESVFAVGSEMVVPRPEAAFARGETLRLYLQVYGAVPDPATRIPRIDVSFRFFREEGRKLRRQGPPYRLRGASGASLGLSIPVGDWPVGAYRAEAELRDRVGGRVTRSETSFRITE